MSKKARIATSGLFVVAKDEAAPVQPTMAFWHSEEILQWL
jgi:hypothetical protein